MGTDKIYHSLSTPRNLEMDILKAMAKLLDEFVIEHRTEQHTVLLLITTEQTDPTVFQQLVALAPFEEIFEGENTDCMKIQSITINELKQKGWPHSLIRLSVQAIHRGGFG